MNTITAEDGTAWYEFVYSNIFAELFNGYHFVRVEDMLIENRKENEQPNGS